MTAKERAAKSDGTRVAKLERASSQTAGSQTDPDVIAFLRKLNHPLKPEIEAVRQIILGVSPEIREGIKWNSPSFRTSDYFATVNLRAKDGQERVWLILHTGAKVKASATKGLNPGAPGRRACSSGSPRTAAL